jgi:hypothetical protein
MALAGTGKKWGQLAQRYYKLVEWVCARTNNALVTDNPVMREYYLNEYGTDSNTEERKRTRG